MTTRKTTIGLVFTRFKKISEPVVIRAAGVLGLALRRS